jgi:phosphatidate cytidylyltransferase
MNLLFIVAAIHFVLGGLGIFIVNRKLDHSGRKMNWLKYFVYLIVFIIILVSILVNKNVFAGLVVIIFAGGLFEILRLGKGSTNIPVRGRIVFMSLLAFSLLAFFFFLFVLLPPTIISYTYIIVIVFDGASQISGQIAGKRKIMPVISPGKTWEGLIGGTISAVVTSLVLNRYVGFSALSSLSFGLMVCFASFAGDMAASSFKRAFGAKDFGTMLPGQGGVLDRFDSFISTGAAVGILSFLTFYTIGTIDRNLAAYLGCSLILAAILLAGEMVHIIFRMKAEYSRIITHVLAGILCIFFIRFFSSEWYVVSLCTQSAIFIFLTKKMGIFGSHHKVVRNTNGSSIFFIGILVCYLISFLRNDVSLYILPVAVLTLSDPVASLSGMGRTAGFWPGLQGTVSLKTYIGSFGFFLSAFVILTVGMSLFYSFSTSKIMVLSLVISLIATAAEAVSSGGTDNLSVPLAVALSMMILTGI